MLMFPINDTIRVFVFSDLSGIAVLDGCLLLLALVFLSVCALLLFSAFSGAHVFCMWPILTLCAFRWLWMLSFCLFWRLLRLYFLSVWLLLTSPP